ncbi:MAG: hypothetical protein Harvfovirus59_6 [Harvfovirus sp.]|uniref:Uncharacterized protein n=1 Tax=Harvfovirus sp. TaxID=2487768 RepID=A0A3G5A690_9VIRU|nr:MAG: hypothetical protein Harvfovirus59_6 [Harvfovirus sp.]
MAFDNLSFLVANIIYGYCNMIEKSCSGCSGSNNNDCCDSIAYIECQIVKINKKIKRIIGVLGTQNERIIALEAKVGSIQMQLNDLIKVVATQKDEIAVLTERVNILAGEVFDLIVTTGIQATQIFALTGPPRGQFMVTLNGPATPFNPDPLPLSFDPLPPPAVNIVRSPDALSLFIFTSMGSLISSSGIYQCYYSLDVTNATPGVLIFYNVLIVVNGATLFTSRTSQNTINNNLQSNPQIMIQVPPPDEGSATLQIQLLTTMALTPDAVNSVVLPSSYINLLKISN